mgnify:CR=1 FL=1
MFKTGIVSMSMNFFDMLIIDPDTIAFLFATFNALSFQVVLSSPMVLYAKSLGASATVLGPHALPQQPVVWVSWFAASAYCQAQGAHLPTWS